MSSPVVTLGLGTRSIRAGYPNYVIRPELPTHGSGVANGSAVVRIVKTRLRRHHTPTPALTFANVPSHSQVRWVSVQLWTRVIPLTRIKPKVVVFSRQITIHTGRTWKPLTSTGRLAR